MGVAGTIGDTWRYCDKSRARRRRSAAYRSSPIYRRGQRRDEPHANAITRRHTGDRRMLLQTGILPEGHLFKPLLADPRWAHFSAAYRNYVGNNIDGNNNGAVSFGETIPFYRANLRRYAAQWEVGLQAAVFSDFNLGRHGRT